MRQTEIYPFQTNTKQQQEHKKSCLSGQLSSLKAGFGVSQNPVYQFV